MSDPRWCQDYPTVLDRSRNQDALDEHISAWTSQLTAEDVMEKLQQAGVPASIVSQGQDLYASPHLKAREFYRPTPYYLAERGTPASQWQEGDSLSWSMPFQMSETPLQFGHYSNIGEDNPYVFEQLLGKPQDEIDRLSSAEVIY